MTVNSILVNGKDNVCVAIKAFEPGDVACYRDGSEFREVKIATSVPVFHKFARADISKGEHVVKYGECIGAATSDIKIGEHVHTHNVESLRQKF